MLGSVQALSVQVWFQHTLCCFRLTTRMSLRELEKPENKKKRNDFLKAWKLIKQLPPTNPNSFWSIASYHGMPFKSRQVDPLNPKSGTNVWGGYCQHGNVLFPTWHRFYCLRLEQALQAVLPDGDVALHYWDETSPETLTDGAPPLVMQEHVTIDGELCANPLLNYTFPIDLEGSDESYYKKKAGYTTCRYPFSGIRNPRSAEAIAEVHNSKVCQANETTDELLQDNILHWLNVGRAPAPAAQKLNSVFEEFKQCLNSPNYNVFSNTTSASVGDGVYQALEQPHNEMHLMVGGYSTPDINEDGSVKTDDEGNVSYRYYGLIRGANGDMGANEVAAFDPIFFLHHCNIDRMFWVWQKKWHHEDDLAFNPEDPSGGTTPEAQGITPNQTPDQTLNMQTVLYPFQDEYGLPRASEDCVNVETQLGYTYSIGSLDQKEWPTLPVKKQDIISLTGNSWDEVLSSLANAVPAVAAAFRSHIQIKAFINRSHITAPRAIPLIHSVGEGFLELGGVRWKENNYIKISNLDKDSVSGSFMVQAFYKNEGKLFYIGQRGVLDRWERENCANCQRIRKTAVGVLIDDVMQYVSDPKNVQIHIVSKDPTTADLKTDILEYEPATTDAKARFDIITSFEQML